MRTVRISRRSVDGFRAADRGEPALTIQAPAKLNLTLDVLGRRDDGFHELESLMVTVGWFDTLTVSPADALTLSVTGAVGVPTDERNLVIRAARALERAIGRRPGAALRLHKRIPHEAGLGGGSSDAAATLSALNELWQAGLDRAELSEIAATVGSDVPLFLCGAAAAVVRGRGERIEPLAPGPPRWAVIAKPPVGLSTARVFQAWAGRRSAAATGTAVAAFNRPGLGLIAATANDLDAPATELEPRLETERIAFERIGLTRSCLSGSGTSRFALCRNAAAARNAAARLRRCRPGPAVAVPLAA